METNQNIRFKTRLHQFAITLIEKRIQGAADAMHKAQEAANEEEKSSAGDKYETSRAMSHIEKDMHARQMEENRKELAQIGLIDPVKVYNEAIPGAFFKAGDNNFYIAAGLGKIDYEGTIVFMLSPKAPLAIQVNHKQKGDTLMFNGIESVIKELF